MSSPGIIQREFISCNMFVLVQIKMHEFLIKRTVEERIFKRLHKVMNLLLDRHWNHRVQNNQKTPSRIQWTLDKAARIR